jgi:hypothetical protein
MSKITNWVDGPDWIHCGHRPKWRAEPTRIFCVKCNEPHTIDVFVCGGRHPEWSPVRLLVESWGEA